MLRRLRRRDPAALEAAMAQYGAYVMTVIRNRSRGVLTPEDHEELASDVFLALWQNAPQVTPGYVRPWLGAVARNRTVDALRRRNITLPLEDVEADEIDGVWQDLCEKQRREQLRRALKTLPEVDREIFYRFYDLSQTTTQIAEAMQLNASTVRSRLKRGRETLRAQLCKGGCAYEDQLE